MRDNKNNMYFYMNWNQDNKKIFDFTIKNTSSREYKNIDIKTPTNIINIEDLF